MLTPFEEKYNPFNNRKHHRLFNGTWTYSPKPYSQKAVAIRSRRHRERIKTLIDARICVICNYGFISRGGANTCSWCWKSLCRLYRRSKKSFRGRSHLVMVRQWASKEFSLPNFHRKTVVPHIPIPNPDSAEVVAAIEKTLEMMKKSAEDGIWYVDQMPRLLGLMPYKVEDQ